MEDHRDVARARGDRQRRERRVGEVELADVDGGERADRGLLHDLREMGAVDERLAVSEREELVDDGRVGEAEGEELGDVSGAGEAVYVEDVHVRETVRPARG